MNQKQLQQLKIENTELKRQLEVCMKWMKKEIQQSHSDSNFIQAQKEIQNIFGDNYSHIPASEQISWIESEQKHLHYQENTPLDGIIVTIMYQKIFESHIEQNITKSWRQSHRTNSYPKPQGSLSKMLMHVLKKDYHLSYGKIISLLEIQDIQEDIITDFKDFLHTHTYHPILLRYLPELKNILKNETFTGKRHAGVVTKQQVQEVRDCFL